MKHETSLFTTTALVKSRLSALICTQPRAYQSLAVRSKWHERCCKLADKQCANTYDHIWCHVLTTLLGGFTRAWFEPKDSQQHSEHMTPNALERMACLLVY